MGTLDGGVERPPVCPPVEGARLHHSGTGCRCLSVLEKRRAGGLKIQKFLYQRQRESLSVYIDGERTVPKDKEKTGRQGAWVIVTRRVRPVSLSSSLSTRHFLLSSELAVDLSYEEEEEQEVSCWKTKLSFCSSVCSSYTLGCMYKRGVWTPCETKFQTTKFFLVHMY